MNEQLVKINKEISALKKSQPYDARTKAYKDAEKSIKTLSYRAKRIIALKAIDFMSDKNNDLLTDTYNFILKESTSKVYGELKFDDGFIIYIDPSYYPRHNIEDDYTGNWGITLNLYSRFGNWLKNGGDAKKGELDITINKAHQEYLSAKEKLNINNQHSTELYRLVKDDITNKSYTRTENEGKEWFGDKLEMEHTLTKNDWQQKSRLEIEFYNKIFQVRADIRVNFDNAQSTKLFWDEYKALVEKHTNFKKSEER